MIRKITLLLLLCVGMHNIGRAQYSGFESAQQRLTSTNPRYAQQLQQMTAKWANWPHTNPTVSGLTVTNGTSTVFQIPVVFHVILPGSLTVNAPGTTYDPTDAQINAMLTYLNQSFSATYSAYPDSNSGGTYIPIQFVLAQRDSNCNSSTGIERIDGSSIANYVGNGIDNGSGTGAVETAVKNLSRWPVNQYYNIYIVNKIDGKDGTVPSVAFTTGFAYLPPAPANVDGYVMLASQVGAGNENIVHEMGHALSVLNTFQGGSVTVCPADNDCSVDGDQVCDTPPELQSNFICHAPTDINSCTGLPYDADKGGSYVQHNFMDYSGCQDRFTPGQRTRMIFGLFTYRAGWLGSQGGVAPGTSPVATSCVPTITNPGNTNDAGVTEFKIADATFNTYLGNTNTYLDYASGGYNGDGNNAYIDLTCHQQATLTAGNTYKFFVKTGGYPTGENVAVFIDYNNDGTFAANEQVFAHTGAAADEDDSALVSIPTTISNPTMVTCLPLRLRVISDPSAAISACGPLAYGQAEDYTVVIAGAGSSTGTVNITLPIEADTSCNGTALTFTAKASSDVDTNTATYQWYVNNVYTGSAGKTYTTSNIANGATVTAKLNFTNQCGAVASSFSNAIVVHRFSSLAPRVAIALTAGNNPGCPGTQLTFTATPFNGGSTAAYQWMVNGTPVGGNTATFTSSALNATDTVSCVLYSSSSCAFPITAASNKIGILHYYLTAALTITATPNPSCTGANVVIKASSLNQSANSQFQWYINSTPVANNNSDLLQSSTLQNTDIVRCVMTSPSACIVNHADTSNPIVISIAQALIPTVSSSIQSGNNPGCLDSFITFTGTITSFATPNYEWLVNGVPEFNGLNYTTDSLQNGDMVTLRVNAADNGCYTQDTVFSLPITVTLGLTPDQPVVSLIHSDLVANSTGTFLWFGPEGLIPGVSGQTYHPTEPGFYYIERIDTNCASAPSNPIQILLTGVNQYHLSSVKIYPNPTTGLVMIDWGTSSKNMGIAVYNALGQAVLYNEVVNQTSKTIDLGFLPSGNYFVVLRDEEGKTSNTTTITLTNK